MKPNSSLPDYELLQAISHGQDGALLELFDRYGDRVLGLARKICFDLMIAEEVTQEVFLRVWQKADQFDPRKGKLRTWLLTIARNRAIDRMRKEGRRPPREAVDWIEDDWRPEVTDPLSEGDEPRWRSLRFALAELPAEQRETLILAYYHGMSHSQIAEYLGEPLGTVKTRIRLGMDKLRKSWREGASDAGDRDVYQGGKDMR